MSTLLLFHIITCSVGYMLFGAACFIACAYIKVEQSIKSKTVRLNGRFPWSLQQLDRLMFATLIAGFALLSTGIPAGLMIQKSICGQITLISPRIILPLTVWSFYLLILVYRLRTGLRGRIPAYLAVCGFNFAVVSFLYEIHLTTA